MDLAGWNDSIFAFKRYKKLVTLWLLAATPKV